MQTFQWNAGEYAKSSSIQQEWARELIRKLALRGDETLLDIGSGDGKVTAEIAMRLPDGKVVGIDSSEEMVDLAQNKYPPDACVNLQFQLMDAGKLGFDNQFDVVFSNAALHWVFDHRPVLQGIYQGLRHGGRILLQMGGRGNADEVMDVIKKLMIGGEWRKYFDGFKFSYGFHGPDEYRKWLQGAGLDPKRIELIPKDAEHKGRTGLESWIRTTWLPYTYQVPEEKRESFISELADGYLEKHPADKDGVVHVKMVRLEVEAMKN
jgi:trans-aconitate 2-methyltransferase